MTTSRVFQEPYQEQTALSGGERVRIRLVGPEDKRRLLDGFQRLSADSRYRRFMSEKKRLTDEELAYFTEMDQVDHFAMGIVELDEKGDEGDGIAVGRFIRLKEDPECAEVGLTVIDRMQGKGVGRMLLEKLMAAAVERDIRRFRFECLPQNQEMRHLVLKVCRDVTFTNDAGVMVAEAALTDRSSLSHGGCTLGVIDGLVRLMQGVASETLTVQSGIGLEVMRRSLDAPFDPWPGRLDRIPFPSR